MAQFKYTVVILKNGSQILTGLPVDVNLYKTENKITNEEVLKILAVYLRDLVKIKASTDKKDQKKDKKKSEKAEETKQG